MHEVAPVGHAGIRQQQQVHRERHRHEGCRYAYTPKSRIEFWHSKFDSNIRRDQQVSEQIKDLK
jgi:G:T-mismatch repair DNA endonuclease (very short patch repair protein)